MGRESRKPSAPDVTTDYIIPTPTEENAGNTLDTPRDPKHAGKPDDTSTGPMPAQSLVGKAFGEFELVQELGRGGMGVVYKARQKNLDRFVAVKVLGLDAFQHPTTRSRFLAEARVSASLHQPNIVTIFDAGESPYGPYYAMEYVEGQTLEKLLRQRTVPLDWAVSLLIRLAEAVYYAHERGVIHRDLKPSNIMIEGLRRPVILDFGIAKFLGKGSALTETGVILGSPAYMSPEQARGGAQSAGPLSDIYSLGAILYRVLAGRVPYHGATAMDTLLKVVGPDMPPAIRTLRPDVPAKLERICLRCLSKDPAGRYASGRALSAALRPLRAALKTGDSSADRPAAPERERSAVPGSASPAPPLSARPPRTVQFEILEGPDKGLVIMLPANDSLMLGRSRAAETRLTDPQVARIHCNVRYDGDRVVVDDFHSTGGTFVNGQRVAQHELRANDVVQIGGTKMRLLGDAPPAAEPEPEAEPESAHEPAPPPAAKSPSRQDLPTDILRAIERSSWPTDLNGLVGMTFGHYELVSVLGKGRTGLVFAAHDTRKDRPAVVKVIEPEVSGGETRQDQFVKVYKAMSALRHPNLVSVYRAGKTGPYCWVAAEQIEGQSLARMIESSGQGQTGRVEWRYAFRVAWYVGQALTFAHGQGLVHRHITPGNILVRARNKLPKLNDLVLASALGERPEEIADPRRPVADLAYLSPEQARGEENVDGRCDLYGLGATLYTILTGRPPFEAASGEELLAKVRDREPLRPSRYPIAIPAPFDQLVVTLLSKEAGNRPQSAGDVLDQLGQIARTLGL